MHGRTLTPWLARIIIASLWLSGIGALGAGGLMIVRHLGDASQINHVAGAWTALTKYVVDEGTLYPPLHDEATGRYGGTRFGPLGILLNAAAAGATGEFVQSGKVVSAVAMAALLALLVVALRRSGCPPALACALAGCVLLTHCALRGAMSIRGDTVPVLLQLAALMLIWGGTEGHPEDAADRRRSRRARLHLAAVLCAIAVPFKLSAIWGTGAIGLWLLFTDRRRLATFCAIWWVLVPLIAIGFHLATEGRMVESMFGLATSGLDDGMGSPARAPWRLLQFLVERAQSIWPLLPLVALSIVAAASRRTVEPAAVALLCAVGVLLIVLSDSGAQYNHLLDTIVLATLPIGWLWRRTRVEDGISPGQGIIAAVVVGAIASGFLAYAPRAGAGATTTGDGAAGGSGMAPMRPFIPEGARILAEDPYIPVSLGELPVVLDPWMLQRIGAARPEAVQPLAERIAAQEFDVIILFRPLTDEEGQLVDWYRRNHFGPIVSEAMAAHYRPDRPALGFHLYVPRHGAAPPSAPGAGEPGS